VLWCVLRCVLRCMFWKKATKRREKKALDITFVM
jgi:hypothetical protein